MTYEELGKALSEARNARGQTLRDVERDTRISTKYLQALEQGDLEALPAPVYARAFMRTYAQYLGLNAANFVQHLPGAKPEPELPPLPQVGREATYSGLSASWVIAGIVVVVLVIAGLGLFWSRGGSDGTESVSSDQPAATEPNGQGSDAPRPTAGPPPGIDVREGIVPDVESLNVLKAIQALNKAGLPYLVIEVENEQAAVATVFQQSPSPGTLAGDSTAVTLLVSR